MEGENQKDEICEYVLWRFWWLKPEDFFEWFLKRKASDKVKIIFAYSLGVIWILFWFKPHYFIFMLEAVVIIFIVYWLYLRIKKVAPDFHLDAYSTTDEALDINVQYNADKAP